MGIRAFDSDYYFLINNDMMVTEKWFHPLIESAEAYPDAGLVAPTVVFTDGKIQYAGGKITVFKGFQSIGWGKLYSNYDRNRKPYRTIHVHGGACLISRRVFKRIGLFDEEFSPGYYEELDFQLRAIRAGSAIYHDPRSVIIHVGAATARKMEPDKFIYI